MGNLGFLAQLSASIVDRTLLITEHDGMLYDLAPRQVDLVIPLDEWHSMTEAYLGRDISRRGVRDRIASTEKMGLVKRRPRSFGDLRQRSVQIVSHGFVDCVPARHREAAPEAADGVWPRERARAFAAMGLGVEDKGELDAAVQSLIEAEVLGQMSKNYVAVFDRRALFEWLQDRIAERLRQDPEFRRQWPALRQALRGFNSCLPGDAGPRSPTSP